MRKVFKQCLLIFMCSATMGTADSFSQSGTLNGKVKDGNLSLQGATVAVAGQMMATDSIGEFSLSITPGTYTLSISHIGYQKIEKRIRLSSGESRSFLFNMLKEGLMGEVIVLGSRSLVQRSNLNTSVPVDQISSIELKETGQPLIIQMLNFTVPSFNISRQHLTEPVSLRKLSPDHLLILVNGTRYHSPSALNSGGVRGTVGRGGVGNDLNSIPFSAIEKIQILRDGASAQYGSDAIAGVMNIVLKKTTGETIIKLHLGQQYEGDGEGIVLGINRGIRLNEKGFLNFSGDYQFRKPTYRGGEYQGTVYYNIPANANSSTRDSIIDLDNRKIGERKFSRKIPVSNDGSIELNNFGFLVNGGYHLNNKTELFLTGSFNYRHPIATGQFRFPKNSNQVNTALYNDGFKPRIIFNSMDISGIGGARGVTNNAWRWDLNSVIGNNTTRFYNKNTNNASQASLLVAPQTSFYAGTSVFTQQTNTISFARDLTAVMNGVKTFHLVLGAEYRFENYRLKKGEEAAWKNYDPSGRTQGGSQPAPGVNPEDEVNEKRSVAGLFADLETDITDHFLINIAGRYENYNDFGDNLAGKLALRYKLSSVFTLRGSAGNGYHAPALQQIYYSSTGSGVRRVADVNIPVRIGTFSNNSAVARDFGVRPLQPENALNLSSGFNTNLSTRVHATVDAYWIQIKNRIVLSGVFDKTNPYVNAILQNRPDVDQIQFTTNAINTETRGVDLVVNGNWKIFRANLDVTLAANFSRTNVFGPIQTTDKLPADSLNTNTLFNREEREKMEYGQPGSKIILSASYKREKTAIQIRTTRFGKTSAVFNSAIESQDEFFSAKILTDINISFRPKEGMSITAGANNILDVYPDPMKNSLNKNQGILIYSNEAMPFGYNGGYYFVNMAFSF